jgi:nucleotide-binding universal stress UspA family protein
MKILLAVDGSSFTKKMLAYLATHDSLFAVGNDYTVFTVRPALPARAVAVAGRAVVDSYHSEEAEKVLAPVTKFLLRHGIDAKSSWKTGPVGVTIAKLASSGKFDLVVMGSHGHGALMNMVMGSVATQVLAQCEVPVLMVR